MARRRADLERVLATSGASLRRLAWLLTGDADAATDLLRDALVATYLSPGGETDAERTATARHELLKAYLRGNGPTGAAEFGARGTRREWAVIVLVHVLGRSERAAGAEVGLGVERAAVLARQAAPYADRLRTLEPPATIDWFDADQVVAASGPARTRRRTRRRRAVALGLVGLLVLGGVGVLGSRLGQPTGQATSVKLPDLFADVDVASGRTERLRLSVSGSTIDLRFYGKPATWAHAEVRAPAGPAAVVAGEVRGMPFYVVRGRAVTATLAVGRTASDVRGGSVTVVTAGRWSVLWPNQRSVAQGSRRPLGVLWQTTEGREAAAALPPRVPLEDRLSLPTGALVLGDGRVLTLMTGAGTLRVPIRDGHAVLTTDVTSDPLPYTAVGYGPVDRATTSARVVPEISRAPAASRLYVLSVPHAARPGLPERIPVTLRDGDKVVERITIGRGEGSGR